MSSELERRLREAGRSLPEPDEAATRRARALSLGAIRRKGPRVRMAALLGVAVVVALGVGAGVGTLIAPSGTAARGAVGMGFLPEPGWYVLQSGTRATPSAPAIAIASNVPFDPADDVHGLAESSGLPYATLLTLPPGGIVITAIFTPRGEKWADAAFETTGLPLRVRDAVADTKYGGQVRPEEPLGVYRLQAAVNGHNVDIHAYFGTPQPSRAHRAETQRQLDQLVVRSRSSSEPAEPATRGGVGAGSVIDETLACVVLPRGGLYQLEIRGHDGYRVGAAWSKLPYIVVASGFFGRPVPFTLTAPANSMAWITAGRPAGATTVDNEFQTFAVKSSGTLGLNRERCRASKVSVPLTPSGLRGGGTGALGEKLDCAAPRRVVIRVRAVLGSAGELRDRRGFRTTNVPIRDAKLAVRTLNGKPLVYAEVQQSGASRLFTAKGCVPD